jgi:predicted metal-dependent phosphoesterase TrpH
MSPKNIIKKAKERELDIIGICDHNSCENVPYVRLTAEKEGIRFIGGMEITSREEVHILALFDNEEELFAMQKVIYDNLHGFNDEKLYGYQIIVNEENEILEYNNKLLINSTELTVEKIVNTIHELNGLAIASHIDRESFSIISQLGFIPNGLNFDALEISTNIRANYFKHLQTPLITSSDAHTLDAIGSSFTRFFMEEVNLGELKKSILGEGGRKVIV